MGCGNPTRFADIKEGDTVVDLGSGAGIDVFLAANIVKKSGKVIGVDMTDNMLNKAKKMRNNTDTRMLNLDKEILKKGFPLKIIQLMWS